MSAEIESAFPRPVAAIRWTGTPKLRRVGDLREPLAPRPAAVQADQRVHLAQRRRRTDENDENDENDAFYILEAR